MDKKEHKCRNKAVCEKACIREHNRLMEMNKVYEQIRTILQLHSKTSKAKILVEAIQYLKMLEHVSKTTDRADGDDNSSDGNEPVMKTGETAEQLERQYTLNVNFRAILPEELQSMELSALANEIPYMMKLLTLNPAKPTAAELENDCNEPENGSNASCLPMEVDDDEHSEQPTTVEEVIEQPPVDKTNVSFTQNPSCFSANSERFRMENQLDLNSESMEVEPSSELSECLRMAIDDEDVEMPTITGLVDSIQSDPPIEDPFLSVQEPEPMEVDYSATTELERNLGGVGVDWLDYNILNDDAFFNHQNRLIYMDTDMEEWEVTDEDSGLGELHTSH
ncbi:uncharacterized protein LOC128298982 [Anopheles moucheti]|uniref:uncharacterized protein LOC128298982 n=1 Tax=Anopheles moucheti TaxID=186751 RepID=UPI0022F02A65|nr:uncharacterized protein LOC128298982 [Anopheles moucheti]